MFILNSSRHTWKALATQWHIKILHYGHKYNICLIQMLVELSMGKPTRGPGGGKGYAHI